MACLCVGQISVLFFLPFGKKNEKENKNANKIVWDEEEETSSIFSKNSMSHIHFLHILLLADW